MYDHYIDEWSNIWVIMLILQNERAGYFLDSFAVKFSPAIFKKSATGVSQYPDLFQLWFQLSTNTKMPVKKAGEH